MSGGEVASLLWFKEIPNSGLKWQCINLHITNKFEWVDPEVSRPGVSMYKIYTTVH